MRDLKEFERPSLTTDMVLFRINDCDIENTRKNKMKELQVLLIQRDCEPEKDRWSLPGGFVDIDEEISENVMRKLYLKTGVKGDFYKEQLYTWGDINRDSRGRVISVSYLGLCNFDNYTVDLIPSKTGWFNVFEVLNGELGDLAFDHKKIIEYAVDRLKNKIEYTDIAFHLLPNEFTIGECQAVYELILQRNILNFRRKVSEYIRPLNKIKKIEGKQFRPAELFSVKDNRDSKF